MDISDIYIEPSDDDLRRELPEMIRISIDKGSKKVMFILRKEQALALAEDLEFALAFEPPGALDPF